MDRADEIARDLWERVWDWDRKEDIADIASALRDFAREAVMEDRRQICGWISARDWLVASGGDDVNAR